MVDITTKQDTADPKVTHVMVGKRYIGRIEKRGRRFIPIPYPGALTLVEARKVPFPANPSRRHDFRSNAIFAVKVAFEHLPAAAESSET